MGRVFTACFLFLSFSITTVLAQQQLSRQLRQVRVKGLSGQGSTIELNKPTVFIFLSPECPLCKSYGPELNKLARSYPAVRFLGIIPGKTYSRQNVRAYKNAYRIAFDLVIDELNQVAGILHATTTPEAVLVEANGDIRYRGLIDNWPVKLGVQRKVVTERYLDIALRAGSGPEKKLPYTKPVGCLINDK